MKVLIIHPPLYPINHIFFNMLGEEVDLTVYSIGAMPRLHRNWHVNHFLSKERNYKLKTLSDFESSKKEHISLRTQSSLEIIQILYSEKPDIVLSVAFWIPSFYISALKYIMRYKFFIITDATQISENNRSFLNKMYRKVLCSNLDGFISGSNLSTDYLKKNFSSKNVYSSFQTIDVKNWKKEIESIESSAELRKKLNIPSDKYVLLGVGNFVQLKNWLSIIERMVEMKDAIFVLIGSGEMESDYILKIQELRLENKVRIVSRKSGVELKEMFKMSDIFIFPTLSDTFGFVVMEALSSGLPVLCSENAGAVSCIEDGVNGYHFKPKENFIPKYKNIIESLEEFKLNALESVKNNALELKVQEYLGIFNDS